MGKLLRRIRYLFRSRQMEAGLAGEMDFHRQMPEREHSAGPAAARAWGNTALVRENARAVWIVPWTESFWQDLAYGVRSMCRQPAFAVVAVGALAIAIAAFAPHLAPGMTKIAAAMERAATQPPWTESVLC